MVAESQVERAAADHRGGLRSLLAVVGPTASGKTEPRGRRRRAGRRRDHQRRQRPDLPRLRRRLRQADARRARARAAPPGRAPRPARARRRRPLRGARARGDRRRARARQASHRVRRHVPLGQGAPLRAGRGARRRARRSATRHRAIADAEGRPALHALLAAVDPVIATRLHPNDFVRVSRALEVHELTGKPMSAWQRGTASRPRTCARACRRSPCDPDGAHRRIAARVRAWLAAGWIDEVRALLAAGYGDARAMGWVGYPQVRAHLEGEIPRAELETLIVRSTRIFARRQRTWLHHAAVTWL